MSFSGQTCFGSPKGGKRPIHALLIGINQYKDPYISDLDCCVNDAEAVKAFLERNPWNLSTNITTLYNEQATRTAIVEALRTLRNNTVGKDDPIFIFYAGHGGRAVAPVSWRTTDGHIQMILPYDYLCQVNGTTVHGIPGRTINALLHKLADVKGDNITVIFDCCHSGYGTRTPNTKTRGVEVKIDIPSDLDENDWIVEDCTDALTRAHFTPQTLINSGLASHVLLAACHSTERAQESGNHGYFTYALVSALRSLDSNPFSYQDLIEKIGALPEQHPQCEGKNADRLFLTTEVLKRQKNTYPVQIKGDDYIMEAGTVEGISAGATFRVYEMPARVEIGTLFAYEPGEFSTKMRLPKGHSAFDIQQKAVATQIAEGTEETLRVHVSADARSELQHLVDQACDQLKKYNEIERAVLLVPRGDADLEVKREGDSIFFETLYEPATRHGIKRLDIDIPLEVEKLTLTLNAAAHYYWHLRRAVAARVQDTDDVAFTEVQRKMDPYTKDKNKVFFRHGPNLLHNGVVDIVAGGPKRPFGMSFQNKSDGDVYVWMFYFDHRKMDIHSMHSPPKRAAETSPSNQAVITPPTTSQSKKGYVSLSPGEFIHIGHGNSAVPPFVFSCVKCELDLGFVVIFISTEPVDLSSMTQNTRKRTFPFSLFSKKALEPAEHWHTIVIPIVQRRHAQPSAVAHATYTQPS